MDLRAAWFHSRSAQRVLEFGPLVVWMVIYPVRILLAHAALLTNAFDLSVFDYALWSSLSGRIGDVPFIGQSLFSHHVMPTLLALLPAYALWPSPWFLIVVQLAAVVAGWFMCRAVFRTLGVPAAAAAALLCAFLFSRFSHSAVTNVFHIESLEPALILWMVWAWLKKKPGHYWVALVLALGCKEDMALYVGAFGLMIAVRPESESRRLGLMTATVAAAWLLLSVLMVIPAVRQAEGLSASYPFFEERYQGSGAVAGGEALDRIVSPRSGRKVANLASSVAFLGFAAPGWFAVLVPGMLASLAARPDAMQSAFLGHYFWPLCPWLFLAGAMGAIRVWRRSPRAGLAATVILWLFTIANSPLWISRGPSATDLETARAIRQTMNGLPAEATVWAAPNLLPHIPQRAQAFTLGDPTEPARADVLAFSTVGNLWPLDQAQLRQIEQSCQQDPAVVRMPTVAPLAVFRLKAAAFATGDSPCVAAVRSLDGPSATLH